MLNASGPFLMDSPARADQPRFLLTSVKIAVRASGEIDLSSECLTTHSLC